MKRTTLRKQGLGCRLMVLVTAVLLHIAPSWAITRFFDGDQLSSNLTTSLAQDRYGYIWVGTEYGLNRFDGVRFAQYYADDPVAQPLRDNNVRRLLTDRKGRLWVMTFGGVQLYDELTGTFANVTFDTKEQTTMADLIETRDGRLLVLTTEKGIFSLDAEKMTAKTDERMNKTATATTAHTMMEDHKGRLWICTNNEGLTCIDVKAGKKHHYGEEVLGSKGVSGIGEDAANRIIVLARQQVLCLNEQTGLLEVLMPVARELSARRLFQTAQKELYVGTFGHGIYRLNVESRQLQPVYEKECGSQKVNAFLTDVLQNVWIGCFQGGLSFVSPRQEPFNYISLKQLGVDHGGQPTALFGDRQNHVYHGTEKGGLTSFSYDLKHVGHWLDGQTVISGIDAGGGWLWIGTYANGACRLNTKTGEVQWMKQLRGERIKSLAFDKKGNVYLAVFNKGIRSFSMDGQQELTHNLTLSNPFVNMLLTDSKGLLWIGHYYGFDLYEPQQDKMVEVKMDTLLRTATVYAIVEAHDGIVWLGTNHGLFGYDRQHREWQHYSKPEGLPNEIICGIVEDSDGALWLSTYRGLSRMDTKNHVFTNYYKGNGLMESSYARGLYFTSPQGHVCFAGDKGITTFMPGDIKPMAFLRGLAVTGMQVGNRQHTVISDKLTLPYTDNTFTLYFSTMDFRVPDNVVYEYRFSDESRDTWHQSAPGESGITFTHLSSGRHQLQVRAADNGLSSEILEINIRITPPWYRTWWAYTFLFIIVAGIAFILWQNWWNKKQADTNEEKIKFFVDVSHELRSPLTLIKSPVDTLLAQEHDPQTLRALRNISRNTNRLLSLINEILSIRKIEKGQMHLHYAETVLAEFVAGICHNFDYQAEKRKITISMHSEDDGLTAWIDRENFDKVVNNLLTNAMKYVENGGQIDVTLRQVADEKRRCNMVEIVVRDNGVGIDEEQLRHVFERFYQASARPRSGQMGYGIGLNLAYKVVRLHGGTIEARNRTDVEHGSEFVVRLPSGNGHLPHEQLVDADYFCKQAEEHAMPSAVTVEEKPRRVRKKTSYRVVVVDDDEEIRNFLQTELSATYHITACENGQQALVTITEQVPDLIISDVVMPVMDGIELLHRVKNNVKTSHIPIILLTTKTAIQSRVEGLEEGADAYMDKPFNLEELAARAAGLIANRQRLRGKFSGAQDQEGTVKQIELKGNDQQLMERIMKVVNERLSDEDFNVEALADAVGLSRVQLHRRMKDMTGISVGEFIRNLRLQQAAKLLEKGDVTIAQVTYAVGMANPTHFAAAFKKYFGIPPVEYMNKHKNETKA